jgi:hypothetical protein
VPKLAAIKGSVAPLRVSHVQPSEFLIPVLALQDTDRKGKNVTVSTYGGITNDCRHSSKSWAQAYKYAVSTMNGPVAFGSDFNGDGLAHVGLLPDLIADLRMIGLTDADLDPLFRSAEGFIQVWERSEGKTPRRPCEVPPGTMGG